MNEVLIALIQNIGWLGFAFLMSCIGIAIVIVSYIEFQKWSYQNPSKK